MALYAAIGAEFKSSILKEFDTLLDERIRAVIARTLKQVAHDYELDYKELKSRYCSKESLDDYVPSAKHSAPFPVQTQIVTVDLEVEAEAEVKPSKAKIPSAVMALSKMKKCDLVRECEERGLDSEGTVSQLKERVKDARSSEHPEPVKDKKKPVPKKEPAPKKEKKPAPKKEKKSPVKEPVAPPPPVALEEEKDDDDEPADTEEEDEDICQRADDEEFEEDEDEDNGSSMHDKLRKLLAEANEEEEDYDEDDE